MILGCEKKLLVFGFYYIGYLRLTTFYLLLKLVFTFTTSGTYDFLLTTND